MKKEIPILMSTMMVQSTLKGIKTKTRRTRGLEFINEALEDFHPHQYLGVDEDGLHLMKNNYGATNAIKCPYGTPGDIIWVRESFFDAENFNSFPAFQGKDRFLFKADSEFIGDHKWKPSIHMPKVAARIWLEVTDIRVERLHAITEEDAKEEGVEFPIKLISKYPEALSVAYRTAFIDLWVKINGEESWKANPWVWVISFKVLSTTGKPKEKLEYKTKAEHYDFTSRNHLESSHI